MKHADFESNIRLEFSPIPVISSSLKVQNYIKKAIKYYSDHYSTQMMTTVAIPANKVLTMPDYVELVYKVYDVRQNSQYIGQPDLFQYFYLKFTPAIGRTLTYMEMLALFTFYQNTKDLFWPADTWYWVKPDLYFQGFANSVATVLFKYQFDPEDANFDFTGYAQDWILRYSTALIKIAEGTITRKSKSVDMDSDGDQLVEDGKQEQQKLEDEINGRNSLFVVQSN